MREKKQKSTHVSVILLNSKINQSIKQWSEQSVKRKKLKDIQICSYILIHRQFGRVHRKMGSYYLLRRRPDSRDRKGKITFHQISFLTF